MEANFDRCLDIVLGYEGGFVDDAADPGGATSLGVTLATLSAWRGSPQTIADVQALTKADVAPIFRADYWGLTRCSDLPAGVDLMVFDCAVNQGPGRAVRTLQQAVGVTADGAIGPLTMAAVAKTSPHDTIVHMADIRSRLYQSLPTFPRFGHGWLRRVDGVTEAALQMTTVAA